MTDSSNILSRIIQKLDNRAAGLLDDQGYRENAVLLPLLKDGDEVSLLLEVRSKNLKGQPGEICFPGGQLEAGDADLEKTAVRETTEELGIPPESIEVLGPLDVLWTPFQVKIHPFVAVIAENTILRPNKLEVEEVFSVPLKFFLSHPPQIKEVDVRLLPPEDFPFHLVPKGRDYPWGRGKYPVYFYQYKDYIIWGITARILRNFIMHIE